jgi:hypothetical protein
MWIFRNRKLDRTERLEKELRDKQDLRQKLGRRLNTAEMFVTDRREAGERLALDGASDEALGRAEANTRASEERANTLRAALTQLEEQIAELEHELGATVEQRYRDSLADTLDVLVIGVVQTIPEYEAATTALIKAVGRTSAALPEATALGDDLEAIRREVAAAVRLMCTELRAIAVRTRSGDARIIFRAPDDPQQPYVWQIERDAPTALPTAAPPTDPQADDATGGTPVPTRFPGDPVAVYEPFEHEPFPLGDKPPQPSNDTSEADVETAKAPEAESTMSAAA